MNSIVEKYIVSEISGNGSWAFDNKLAAYNFIRSQEPKIKYMIMPSYEAALPSELEFRATIVVCVYMAPLRTLRAIESCLAQDTTGVEIIVYGDGCQNLANLINSHYFDEKIIEQQLKGNDLVVLNLEKNYGGFGYMQRNLARNISRGKYTMYLDGDDVLLPNHVSTRLEIAESNDFDLIGFETQIPFPFGGYRDTRFEYGKIGHAEIVIRTSYLKQLPVSSPDYGHDWTLIRDAMEAGARRFIKTGLPRTYIIKSLPNFKEQGID